ncbi:MAG TPA: hypothetical protein VKB53_10925 [Gammaproteobacteria bacterium]|nr:hypothetical protein [Gammaproteobacteria bacterium]
MGSGNSVLHDHHDRREYLYGAIFNRMPVILNRKEDTYGKPDDAKALLKPFGSDMEAYPISTRVNSTRNNDESPLEHAT